MLFVSGAALADDAALQNCRAVTDAGARLRCYDAIPLAAANAVAVASSATAAAAAKAAPAAASAEQNFGIEQVKKKEDDQPKSIESTIVGNFDGWGPNARIKLANGQIWRVVDGSEAVLAPMQNPKVTIERNMFGTMFLRVEGSNNSAKVRRVQ
jgi:hypothetical protein